MDNNITRAWELYELGRTYNSRLTPDQYRTVETNTEFFIGNQWLHLPQTRAMRETPKPVFNILKRVASLFIASLTSSGTTLHFEPLAYYDGGRNPFPDDRYRLPGQEPENPEQDAASYANAEIGNLWEKFKLDYRLRDALFDGAVTGDYAAHFWFDPDALPYGGGGVYEGYRGEIRMELVDGINVMFGNPNDRNTENQPYILLIGRDTVQNLQSEARRFRENQKLYREATAAKDGEEAGIQPDNENFLFPGVGGKTELDANNETGKVLYVLMYSKKERKTRNPDGTSRTETTVHVTKATRNAVIYEDVDTGLSCYPLAWGNWEKQKNQYHGRALITGLIPNQIYINTMFATALRHLQTMAFPKTVYNADLISVWPSGVGEAVGVHGIQPGQGIPQVAANLPAAEMSGQIFALIDKVTNYTKDCLGATDAQMGNVKPDNTSALMVLQTNAEVPLENIRAGVHEWVEDIGRILLDMMGTYYGRRPVVTDEEMEELVTDAGGLPQINPVTGLMMTQNVTRKVTRLFDFSVFKRLWLNLRVDVGATTYFSEIAMTQTLDNLRRDGTLDVIQYLERLPDKLIPQKDKLIEDLKRRQTDAAMQQPAPQPSGNPAQAGPLDEAAAVQGLPAAMAAGYDNLNATAKRTAREMGARALR